MIDDTYVVSMSQRVLNRHICSHTRFAHAKAGMGVRVSACVCVCMHACMYECGGLAHMYACDSVRADTVHGFTRYIGSMLSLTSMTDSPAHNAVPEGGSNSATPKSGVGSHGT